MAAAAYVCKLSGMLASMHSGTGAPPNSSITNYLCHGSPFHWKSVQLSLKLSSRVLE